MKQIALATFFVAGLFLFSVIIVYVSMHLVPHKKSFLKGFITLIFSVYMLFVGAVYLVLTV